MGSCNPYSYWVSNLVCGVVDEMKAEYERKLEVLEGGLSDLMIALEKDV